MGHNTIDARNVELIYQDSDFTYQYELTKKLDGTNSQFSQELLNEIVLWKVNRYVLFDQNLIKELNTISSWNEINESKTREILTSLLKTKGVQLAMASTILRFRNPNIFQIIDQRAYRVINKNETLKLSQIKDTSKATTIDKQINLYLRYIEQLRIISKDHRIPFNVLDRALYNIDKQINKSVKLK
jgi:hypothetical protein